jgi:hypothetical protein
MLMAALARRCLRRILRPTVSMAGRGRSAGKASADGSWIAGDAAGTNSSGVRDRFSAARRMAARRSSRRPQCGTTTARYRPLGRSPMVLPRPHRRDAAHGEAQTADLGVFPQQRVGDLESQLPALRDRSARRRTDHLSTDYPFRFTREKRRSTTPRGGRPERGGSSRWKNPTNMCCGSSWCARRHQALVDHRSLSARVR